MSEYVTYLDGGRTNAEGLYKYLNRLFSAGVPTIFAPTSMQVSQRGAGANMSVDVAVGDVMLNMPTGAYALWGYTDAVKNVVLTAANATNPRIDTIVVYADATAFTSGTSNNPGALKFVAVAGTPSGTPSAPNTTAIQTAIGGSTIPYQVLANVAVAANATTITTGNITDTRSAITPKFPTSSVLQTNPYKFTVYRSAGYTTVASSATLIPFDAKSFDTSANVDIVSNKGRFTAPVAGYYSFSAGIGISGGTSRIILMLYKNGAEAQRICDIGAGGTNLSQGAGSGFLQLAAGDYVEVDYFMNNAVALSAGVALNYFNGFLVSTT